MVQVELDGAALERPVGAVAVGQVRGHAGAGVGPLRVVVAGAERGGAPDGVLEAEVGRGRGGEGGGEGEGGEGDHFGGWSGVWMMVDVRRNRQGRDL